MKKLIIVLLILLIPAGLFAEVRLGPVAFWNHPLLPVVAGDQTAQDALDQFTLEDITFGADFRLKLFLFQASAMALFTPGLQSADTSTSIIPASFDIFLDAGLSFQILILRLGIGAGPNFTFFTGDTVYIDDPVSWGANVKSTVDIVLGPISFGLIHVFQFDFQFDDPASILSPDKTQSLLGLSVLFGF